MLQPPDPVICPFDGTVVIKDSKHLQGYLIPPQGIKCQNCGNVVVQGNNARLSLVT